MKKATAIVASVLFAILGASAAAQPPSENRGIRSIDIKPGTAPGLFDINVKLITETAATDTPKDLSTELAVEINGVALPGPPSSQVATIAASGGACLGTTPPCDNSNCGTWNFGVVTLEGSCVPSLLGRALGLDFCTCACVVVNTAASDVPLGPGDSVTVTASPAPGALPETETADDSLTTSLSVLEVPSASAAGLLALAVLLALTGLYFSRISGA